MKNRIIFFKKNRVRLITTKQSLELNFRRRDIKKLVKDFVGRTSRLHVREAKSYLIEIEIKNMVATLMLLKNAMVRRT